MNGFAMGYRRPQPRCPVFKFKNGKINLRQTLQAMNPGQTLRMRALSRDQYASMKGCARRANIHIKLKYYPLFKYMTVEKLAAKKDISKKAATLIPIGTQKSEKLQSNRPPEMSDDIFS